MNLWKLISASILVVFASTAAAQAQSLLVLNKEGSVAIIDPATQRFWAARPPVMARTKWW